MVTTALLSTVVMSGVLLVVLALVLRLRSWQHPAPSVSVDAEAVTERVNTPLGWSVSFFVGTFLVMGLAVLYASGVPIAGIDTGTLRAAFTASLAAVFAIAGLIATYGAARSRGLNSAQAAGLGAAFLATLAVVAIVVQLFVGG